MMFGTGSNAESTRNYERVKVQNDIRTSKHINKQTFPVFNCVTPESVSLAPLTNNILFFYFFPVGNWVFSGTFHDHYQFWNSSMAPLEVVWLSMSYESL